MPIVIIGGVTAVGKSSTAKRLCQLYQWDYIEADEYHPPENIHKMQSGIALNDNDRLPWLLRLHEKLKEYSDLNQSCVITCSALKPSYRRILLTGSSNVDSERKSPPKDFSLIMLTLSRESLHERLIKRQHEHFMHPDLLNSQLATLELPTNPTDEPFLSIIKCDGLSEDEVIQRVQQVIEQ